MNWEGLLVAFLSLASWTFFVIGISLYGATQMPPRYPLSSRMWCALVLPAYWIARMAFCRGKRFKVFRCGNCGFVLPGRNLTRCLLCKYSVNWENVQDKGA